LFSPPSLSEARDEMVRRRPSTAAPGAALLALLLAHCTSSVVHASVGRSAGAVGAYNLQPHSLTTAADARALQTLREQRQHIHTQRANVAQQLAAPAGRAAERAAANAGLPGGPRRGMGGGSGESTRYANNNGNGVTTLGTLPHNRQRQVPGVQQGEGPGRWTRSSEGAGAERARRPTRLRWGRCKLTLPLTHSCP
jgi:hypothetical protein